MQPLKVEKMVKLRGISRMFIRLIYNLTPLLLLLLVLNSTASNAESVEIENNFDISEYKGKVVYLDFWASWCIPCRKSFPWMNQMRQNYSEKDLVIIAINLDKKRALANDFLQDYSANFNIIYDPKGSIAKYYQIKGMPSSIIFDRHGKARFAHTGFFTESIPEYEQQIRQLAVGKDSAESSSE
jgi:thiol-disulfide isomerase/thioredoxin